MINSGKVAFPYPTHRMQSSIHLFILDIAEKMFVYQMQNLLIKESIISASYFVLVHMGPKMKTERQAREIYSSQQYAESLMQLWNNNTNGNLYVPYLSKYFNGPRRVKIMRIFFLLMFYSICNSRCVNAWILKCGETGLYCATLPRKCNRAAACVSRYKTGRWPKYDFRSSYSWNLSVPSHHIIYENT